MYSHGAFTNPFMPPRDRPQDSVFGDRQLFLPPSSRSITPYYSSTTPRSSFSSQRTFPPYSLMPRSGELRRRRSRHDSWGSECTLREDEAQTSSEGQVGQGGDVQYAYRPHLHMPHISIPRVCQIPFSNLFRRSTQGRQNDHPAVAPRQVPRSAGYAHVSTTERNNRARQQNRRSNGILRPILINDRDGCQTASELCPDDWHQLIWMPAEDVEELCYFYGIDIFGMTLHESRIAYLRFIGARHLARHMEHQDDDDYYLSRGHLDESELLF